MNSLVITESRIESEDTGHYAEYVGNGGWCVTWLVNRVLDRNQAITAMTLAELVGNDWKPEYMQNAAGALAGVFASELGLTAQEAVDRVLATRPQGAPQGVLQLLDRQGSLVVRVPVSYCGCEEHAGVLEQRAKAILGEPVPGEDEK